MTYNPSYIADLLVKHLIGNLNEEEKQLFDHWLTADERHPQLVRTILDKDRLKRRFEEYRAIDSRGSWEAIRARLPDLQLPEYPNESSPPIRILSFLRNQAALWLTLIGLGMLTAAALLFLRGGKTKKTDVIAASTSVSSVMLRYNDAEPIDLSACAQGWQLRSGNLLFSKPEAGLVQVSVLDPAAPIGRLSLTTPKGANYRLLLPDRSIVNLNADSHIEIDSSYGPDRQVALRGEAYFEVKHRDGQSFTVGVRPRLTITATGTVFDVKAYPKDSSICTKLISGSLCIRDTAGRQHTLEAHQTLIMDRFGQVKAPPVSDTTDEISWVNGQFNYNGTPIREILNDLSHWYGADIEVQGEPKGHFTFSCSRQKPLQFILDRLAATKHLHYKTTENKVIIYFDQP
jgi:transmembrane sensor